MERQGPPRGPTLRKQHISREQAPLPLLSAARCATPSPVPSTLLQFHLHAKIFNYPSTSCTTLQPLQLHINLSHYSTKIPTDSSISSSTVQPLTLYFNFFIYSSISCTTVWYSQKPLQFLKVYVKNFNCPSSRSTAPIPLAVSAGPFHWRRADLSVLLAPRPCHIPATFPRAPRSPRKPGSVRDEFFPSTPRASSPATAATAGRAASHGPTQSDHDTRDEAPLSIEGFHAAIRRTPLFRHRSGLPVGGTALSRNLDHPKRLPLRE